MLDPKLIALLPAGIKVKNRVNYSLEYKLDVLTKGLLEGTNEGSWLNVPWKEHVQGYWHSSALTLRYEDLTMDPFREAKRICKYLGISRNDGELQTAIHRQSFEFKKKEFLDGNYPEKTSLLRRGASDDWRDVLSARNLDIIHSELAGFLNELGYH